MQPLKSYDMEPIKDAVHLCVDMQRIFAKGGIWETPWMERVRLIVADITSRFADRTVFTRFITPQTLDRRPGRWRKYYQRWEAATRERLSPDQLDLLPELCRFVPPAFVIDKPAYSAFFQSDVDAFLAEKSIATVVVTGAETDVCVASTVFDAVDRGLRVIVVEDALCSSSDAGHDALMTMYRSRLQEQIELITADRLPELWKP
jgi:nicotinamidase-related amidase